MAITLDAKAIHDAYVQEQEEITHEEELTPIEVTPDSRYEHALEGAALAMRDALRHAIDGQSAWQLQRIVNSVLDIENLRQEMRMDRDLQKARESAEAYQAKIGGPYLSTPPTTSYAARGSLGHSGGGPGFPRG